MHDPLPPDQTRIARGSAAYGRLRIALFLAGFATFALLYCVQPLLTVFGDRFSVTPAGASLALSLSTGFLAVSIVATTPLAGWLGRKRMMGASMILAALCNIAAAMAPGWHTLLVLRAVEGVVLGGVPAVAMAHLADEIDARELGAVMGLYVGGTAFGGMVGRVGTALVADHATWRTAMAVTGLCCLLAALAFLLLLPPARVLTQRAPDAAPALSRHALAWGRHLRDPGMGGLFLTGFLAMSAFVTIYNYLGFRLLRPPFSLSQGASGAVFMVYLFGILASPLAGRISTRVGRGPVLVAGPVLGLAGIALTLLASLPAVMAGLALVTIGFFVSHSVASASVGHRATTDKGHAASLYLLAYYLGSSVMGSIGGWFWSRDGWPGVAVFAAALLGTGLATALLLAGAASRSGRAG